MARKIKRQFENDPDITAVVWNESREFQLGESVLESLHLSGPVLVVVGFAVSAAVSAASLFVLERPILSAVTLRTGRAGAAARERAALQSSEEAAL